MKLFYIQTPYYWRDLYKTAEGLDIEPYEILSDRPEWIDEEYDKKSTANKIRMWNEDKYGSGTIPENYQEMLHWVLGEGNISALVELLNVDEYQEKIKKYLSPGEDIIIALSDSSQSTSLLDYFIKIKDEFKFRLHVILWRSFPSRTDNDRLLLRYLPFVKNITSLAICNSYGMYKIGGNLDLPEDLKSCSSLFCEIAGDYFVQVKREFSSSDHKGDGTLFLFDMNKKKMKPIDKETIEFDEHSERSLWRLSESVTPGLDHNNCIRLKNYRVAFKEKYDAKPDDYYLIRYGLDTRKQEINERICKYKNNCRGVCDACDAFSEALFSSSSLAKEFRFRDAIIDKERSTAPINGIQRMRIDSDGPGVRSLILMDACYLDCKYCINKKMINRFPLVYESDVSELASCLYKDIPYFDQSGGGVTFGGGEPLIYADFIHQFHTYVPKISIVLETSLNVQREAIDILLQDIDEWIVDVKDMNPEIYYKYTGCYNDQVINNLSYLVERIGPERLRCRIPYIRGFNTKHDMDHSEQMLRELGVERIERLIFKFPS